MERDLSTYPQVRAFAFAREWERRHGAELPQEFLTELAQAIEECMNGRPEALQLLVSRLTGKLEAL